MKKIIQPLDETNGYTQEFDSDPRFYDETHNGGSVNLTDNPGSWADVSDIGDNPEVIDDMDAISSSKIPSLGEMRYRHSSRMSKSSTRPTRRRKKRAKISKEDSDALTLFECESCLYLSLIHI